MDFKKIIKFLIPPIFFEFRKSFDKRKLQPTFNSYVEALEAAGSYEDSELVQVIVAKTKNFIEKGQQNEKISLDNISSSRIVRTLLAIASGVNSSTLTILDFGGSAGVHYFTARKIINKDVKLKWCVVETQEMVNEVLKTGLQNEELYFYSTIDEASKENKEFDIIYTNYALCYTPNPISFLEKLLQTKFKKIFITNTAINKEDKEVIGLQTSTLATNGVGREIPKYLGISDKTITYPFTIPSQKRFEKKILEYGNIIFKIKEIDSSYTTVEGSYDNYGYFITSKNYE